MTTSSTYRRRLWGVALTVLTAVSSLLLPVSAQQTIVFQTSDLAGTWHVYSLMSATTPGQTGGWAYGTLTSDNNGIISSGTFTNSHETSTTLTGSSFTITPTGLVSGNVTSAGLTRPSTGAMTSSKDEIVGVFTVRDATGAQRQFGLTVLVKVTATSFAQTDVAGTWRIYGLGTPQTPGVEPSGVLGKLQIDGSGAVGTLTDLDGTVVVLGGRLTLGTDGLLTGIITF